MKDPIYFPHVSLEEVLEYESGKPETYTDSPFINALIEALATVRPNNAVGIGRHFHFRPEWIGGAVHCIVGVSFTELHDAWVKKEILRLRELHPDWNDSTLAPLVGYYDHTTLYRFLKSNGMEIKGRNLHKH